MNTKKKYDLIFSLGEACSCTQALRNSFLQINSYPFDWLYGSTFENRCLILANEFKDFINKNDLDYAHEERSIKCIAYRNKFNGIVFNHDFLKELPFDQAYTLVIEKYNRRIKRLLDNIKNSSKVLVVYIETPTTSHSIISNENILKGYEILKNKYGEKLDLLYVQNSKDEFFDEKINEHVKKVVCNYKKYNKKIDYAVNEKILKRILNKYEIQLPNGYIIRKKIIASIIKILPVPHFRSKLRKKYHV